MHSSCVTEAAKKFHYNEGFDQAHFTATSMGWFRSSSVTLKWTEIC